MKRRLDRPLKKKIALRCKLFVRQQGLCAWCGLPMVLIARGDGKHLMPRGEPLPDDLCTLDHIDSKLSGERGLHDGEFRAVAACKACNEKRAAREESALTLAELHRRSGRTRSP